MARVVTFSRTLTFVAVAVASAALVPAAQAAPSPPPSTPDLIERAVQRGAIDASRANVLRAYALAEPSKLPAAYRSATPWDGTYVLLELRRDLRRMSAGRAAREIEAALAPPSGGTSCSSSSGGLGNSAQTSHFFVEYGSIFGGLTIADYTASLETAWTAEITSFGWAAPPVALAPAPGSKYHVRIDDLGSGLYGYVAPSGTYAGLVGNNPATAWSDGDAFASCMVLNSDYTGFPSDPRASLDSTTAHEFNHSIQYGLGALNGGNVPDEAFVEGGATWMEDEVFDAANDNYSYLWPTFSDGMGDYDASPYPYWITFRGMTERYGTGVAGGAEDVMQDFWERTSRNVASNLGAMDAALAAEGTTLADAFHAYAIAVKFKKPCGAGYAYPYCFEEASAYPPNTTITANAPAITSVGGTTGNKAINIEDNFAIRFIGLPASGGPYSVSLANVETAGGPGRLRGTVACDTGSALALHPLPAVAADGETRTLSSFDPVGCSNPVLVVTNQTKTADNPSTSTVRRFTVSTAAIAPPPSTFALTVSRSGTGTGTVTSDPAGIDCGADCAATYDDGTNVTLTATPAAGSTFTGWTGEGCSGTGTCRVTMSQARSVTATFAPSSYALSVSRAGGGSGSVTSAPAGIDCGSDCEQTYTHATLVTLTAEPAAGSTFTAWGGACSGTAACVVTMTETRSVTATFEPITHELTVTLAGTGSGVVSGAGIDCGIDCTQAYGDGAVVTLTAIPSSGSLFAGWSGACTGTTPACEVTLNAARSVTATFAPPPTQDEGPNTSSAPLAEAPQQEAPPLPASLPALPLATLTDVTPPRITIGSARLRPDRRGYVRLRITCPASELGGCRGTARLLLLRRPRTASRAAAVILGRATFQIAGGRTVTVRVRLTARARRLLARWHRLRVRAAIRASDAAGNHSTTRRTLTLRR